MDTDVLEFAYRKPKRRMNLKKVYTRNLLQMLDIARAGGYYDPQGGIQVVYSDDIKAELATREHVPNKQEARKIRQEKAFAKRHR